MEKHANKKLFARNVYFVRIFIRLYIYYIIQKFVIYLKLPSLSPKITMLTKANICSV